MGNTLIQTFEERLQEIDTYLDLLESLERQVQSGTPVIGGSAITAQQQRILYSGVFIQLYNLMEATVTWCVNAVCDAANDQGRWKPGDLTSKVRREWVRAAANTHVELSDENRLDRAVKLCDVLIEARPISDFKVDRRRNWDDIEIEAITARLGCTLRISPDVLSGIKRHIRDDKGALALIKDLRNRLGHGSISFSECGENLTVFDLRDLKQRIAEYLREVVEVYREYVNGYEFLIPERRP